MKTLSTVLSGVLVMVLAVACAHGGQVEGPLGSPAPAAEPQTQSAVDEAVAYLAKRLALDPKQIAVLSVEAVDWPDASLGVPEPGMAYAQGVTPGHRVRLQADGKVYQMHCGPNGRLVLASDPDVVVRPGPESKLRAFLDYLTAYYPELQLAEAGDWVLEDVSMPGPEGVQTCVWRAGRWSISISSSVGEENASEIVLPQGEQDVHWSGTLQWDGQFVVKDEPLPGDLGVVFRSLMSYFEDTYPGFGLAQRSEWFHQDVTPPGLLGSWTHMWQSGEWSVVLSYPDGTQPTYSLLVTHARAGPVWSGMLQASGQVISDQPVLLSVEVSPCDETVEVDSLAEWAGIDFDARGGLVYITQRLRYVCCAELALAAGRDGSVVKVVETNIGEVCRCICGYTLEAELNGLQPGTYTIEVWGVQHAPDQPLELLGSAEVTIE
jgi:hypothetical protein